ncbi:MAG: Ig-like domain-containing protein [Vicinamibacterales bacterium]
MSYLKHLLKRSRVATALLLTAIGFAGAELPGHGQAASLTFESGFEGEIWQALPKFGHASTCFDFDLFTSIPGCTPTDEDLLYPVDVAIHQSGTLGSNGFPTDPLNYRVYVTDSFNNRVVAFRYDPTANDADPTDGYGWAPVSLPGAQWTSANLSTPDHVTVDAAGNVYVADYGHNRVVVFDQNGQTLATLPSGVFVYGITITPGAVWGTGGTIAVNGIDFGSGVNHLVFYSAATGAEIDRYEAPTGDFTPGGLTLATGIAYDQDASHLVVADYGATRVVSFDVDGNGLPVDANAFDGTIPNSTSEANPSGLPTMTPALVFGRPTDFANPSRADLQSPFSVNVDSRGRILVGDTDNQRLAAYMPDYPVGSAATSTFLFELNAEGGLNGYPRGLAEDAVGRLIIVDTVNHEIEVFQIPQIAIVDVTVAGPRSFAPDVLRPGATISGSFVAGDQITIDYSVMVPETHFQVTDVVPSCSASDGLGALALDAGPELVGWTADALGDPQTDFATDGDIDQVRPVPTDLFRFRCTFTARSEGAVDFQLNAVGNGGVTASQDRSSTAVVGCGECETGLPDITGQITDPLPAREFYNQDVTIQLDAVDAVDSAHPEDPRASLPPTGIKRVYWRWVFGPLAVIDNDDFYIGCDDYPGTSIQCDGPGLASGDPAGFPYPTTYDALVPIYAGPGSLAEGYNGLEYWTLDAAGNLTDRKTMTVAIDRTPPTALFAYPNATGDCWVEGGVNHCWYRNDVSVPYNLFDNFTPASQITIDGASGPFSALVFNQDGENPPVVLANLADLAGNQRATASSDDPVLNGRVVHIDRLAPVTTFSCSWTNGSAVLDCSSGGVFGGGTVTFSLPSTDDLSGVKQTRYSMSGATNQSATTMAPGGTHVMTSGGATTVTYWSSDKAGNTGTAHTVEILMNGPPVASDDAVTINEDTQVNVNVLANDTDPDGDLLTVAIATPPQHGVAGPASGRRISYMPSANYNGSDSLTYVIEDPHGGTSTGTIAVTILPVNDAPLAVTDNFSTPEETPIAVPVSTLLANDTDVEGDEISWVSAGGSISGTVLVTDGILSFSPHPDFTGTAAFNYTITDGQLLSIGTVYVNVTPVNDPPVAVADTATTPEDTALTIAPATLLANDSDVDGDALSLTAVGGGVNGTVALVSGQVVFTPAADFNGTASFGYTISDGNGETASATVTVTVTAVNDPPVAADDTASTPEDTPITIPAATLLANDTDTDGDTLTVSAVSGAVNGTVALSGSNVVFTPALNFNGAASFTYTVQDGNGGSDTAAVSVTVSAVNDPPVAVDDTASTSEDTPLPIDASALLANDSDVDGDTLAVTGVGSPVNGTVTLSGSTITFTPAPGFFGTASFGYSVSDPAGLSASATVVVTVASVNDPPVAADDAVTTSEDTPVTIPPANLLGNDVDADGDTLSLTAVGGATNGTVAIAGGQVVFTPAPEFSGAASFTYTVSDGNGGADSATVVVTVTAVNDPPVAVDDTATTVENTAVTIDVLGNDSDVDGGALTVGSVTQPTSGAVAINPDGTLTYTPATGFSGPVAFTYTADDGRGGTATATVTVTVTPGNRPPVAVDDTASTVENSPVVIGVLANDSDVDGDTLTVASVTQPVSGAVTINPNATLTYTPVGGFSGTVSFTYTAADGHGGTATATVTVTVTPLNHPPVAVADSYTTAYNTTLTVAAPGVLGNDTDAEGPAGLVAQLVSAPTTGTLTLNGNGSFAFTPAGGFTGITSFTYRVSDGVATSDTATVTILVQEPTCEAGAALALVEKQVVFNGGNVLDGSVQVMTKANVTYNGGVMAGDLLIAGTPTIVINGQPTYGGTIDGPGSANPTGHKVTINGNTTLGHVIRRTDPVALPVVDNPPTNWGNRNVMLNNPGDDPGDFSTIRDLTLNGNVGAVAVPAGTYRNFTANGQNSFILGVPGGTTPAVYNFTELTMNGQSVLQVVGPVRVTIKNAVMFNGLVGTSAHPEWLTLRIAASGGLQLNGQTSLYGYVEVPKGQLVINGGTKLVGGLASKTLTVNGTGQLVLIGRNDCPVDVPINNPPLALDDAATTAEGTAVTIPVLGNDSDVDFDTLSVASVSFNPANATATAAGTVVNYMPKPGFVGTDVFTYTISDGRGGTAMATVTVTVTPTNHPPTAGDDTATVTADQPVTITVLANDSDPDEDSLTVTAVTQPGSGAAAINGNGTITYTPEITFTGPVSFTYTVGDGHGGTATATVSVTVEPPNTQPVALDDQATTAKGAPIKILVRVNDSDGDGDPLSITAVTQPASGLVTINGDGTLTYTPENSFKGTVAFTYTIGDGRGGSATATVTVTVQKNSGGDDDHQGDDGDDDDEDDDDHHGHYPGDRDGCHDYSKNWDSDWDWDHGSDDGDHDRGGDGDRDDNGGGYGDRDGDRGHSGSNDDHGSSSGHYPGDRDGCSNYGRNGSWEWDTGDRDHGDGRGGDYDRDGGRDRGGDDRDNNQSSSGHYPNDRDGCSNYGRNGSWSWNTGGR